MPRTALALLLLSACGGAGTVNTQSAADAPVLNLALKVPGQDLFDLSDLRGRRVLVFVFATWDEISQAALVPLERLHAGHPELQIVGVAAQPDAEQLLEGYTAALEPSFTLSWEPEGTLLAGTSALGALQVIPSYAMIDAHGQVRIAHTGFARLADLESWLAAVPDEPQGDARPPPLLGQH